MKKWEYCRIFEIKIRGDFRDNSRQQLVSPVLNFADIAQIVYISGEKFQRIFLKPFSSNDKQLNIVGKLDDLIQSIQIIFPDFQVDKKQAFTKYFPDIKNLSTEFDKFRWEDQYSELVATLFIQYLLNSGWELMERDGLWFKRELV